MAMDKKKSAEPGVQTVLPMLRLTRHGRVCEVDVMTSDPEGFRPLMDTLAELAMEPETQLLVYLARGALPRDLVELEKAGSVIGQALWYSKNSLAVVIDEEDDMAKVFCLYTARAGAHVLSTTDRSEARMWIRLSDAVSIS